MILSLDIALHLLSGKCVPIYTPPTVCKECLVLYKLSGIENYNLKNVHLMGRYCFLVRFFVYSGVEYFFLRLLASRVSFLFFVIGFCFCPFFFSLLCMSSLHIIDNVPGSYTKAFHILRIEVPEVIGTLHRKTKFAKTQKWPLLCCPLINSAPTPIPLTLNTSVFFILQH